MNQADEFLAENDLIAALQAASGKVKQKPTDSSARTFLFELLLFAGEWERAEKQLDVIGQQSAEALIGTGIYRQCIACERERERVFSGAAAPTFLGAPPADADLLLEAARLLHAEKFDQARETLDRAEDERAAQPGKLNDESEFEDFRDYNDATASILEIFVQGKYVWLPFSQISALEIRAPKTLRDVCWRQGTIETLAGEGGEIILPALYWGSARNADGALRLGKATDWIQRGDNIFVGAGTRLFWFDGEHAPISDVRKIEFSGATE